MKVVINTCFGGFGLSDAAYEKLIEWGVPTREYIEQKRDPITGLYLPEPRNDGEVIFIGGLITGNYWDTWTGKSRTHPLVVRVVEELGSEANRCFANLKVIEIPDGIDWEIDEYDGMEQISEKHRTWA